MKRTLNLLSKLDLLICYISIIGIIGIVCLNVLLRYVFNSPIQWTEEISLALFIWLTFAGVSVVLKDNAHITIDYFVRKAPPKIAYSLHILRLIIFSILLIILVVLGLTLTLQTEFKVTPVLGINYFWIYLSVPVGGIFSLLFLAKVFIQKDRDYIEQKETEVQ